MDRKKFLKYSIKVAQNFEIEKTEYFKGKFEV